MRRLYGLAKRLSRQRSVSLVHGDAENRNHANTIWYRREFQKAAEIHKSIIDAGRGIPLDYERLAFSCRQEGNIDAAKAVVSSGLRSHPLAVHLAAEGFFCELASLSWSEAIAAGSLLYEAYPGQVPAGVFLGQFECLIESGDLDAALSFLSRINELTSPVWRTSRTIGEFPKLPVNAEHVNEKRRLNNRVRQLLDLTPDCDPALREFAYRIMLQTSFSHFHRVEGNKSLVVTLSATRKFTLQKFRFDADVLFLVDVSMSYYCVPSDAAAALIKELVERCGYETVTFIGCSKGATGALSIAAVFKAIGTTAAVKVFAFAPQTQIYPHSANSDVFPSYVNLHKKLKTQPTLIPIMERTGKLSAFDYSGLAECRIIYGSLNNVDTIEANRLASNEGVTLMPLDTGQHYTLGFFTIPADVNIEDARRRFEEVDDPDAVAMRSDTAVEEYLEKSKRHGYNLHALIA